MTNTFQFSTRPMTYDETNYYEAKQVRRKKKLNLYDLIDKDIEKDFNEDNPTYKEM